MEKIPQNPTEFLQAMQDMMPKIIPTKTGYEIRTDVLAMAQSQAVNDYHFRAQAIEHGLEVKGERTEDGTYVQTVTFPTPDVVLEIANKFLEFVNKK